MKRLFVLLAAIVMLSVPLAGSAQAEKIDFGKITCEQFLEFDKETLAMFYCWLDGYFSAGSNNTVLDTEEMEKDLTELLKRCATRKQATVMAVIDN